MSSLSALTLTLSPALSHALTPLTTLEVQGCGSRALSRGRDVPPVKSRGGEVDGPRGLGLDRDPGSGTENCTLIREPSPKGGGTFFPRRVEHIREIDGPAGLVYLTK